MQVEWDVYSNKVLLIFMRKLTNVLQIGQDWFEDSNDTDFFVGRGTGDPHYLTFDGRRHTFNGRGDFTILEIVSEDGVTPEFSIQGRLDRVRRWRVATHQGLTFGNEDLAFHVSSAKETDISI